MTRNLKLDYMPMDGRPLKRPLIWNFVVSSEVVKKNVQNITLPYFRRFCALSAQNIRQRNLT